MAFVLCADMVCQSLFIKISDIIKFNYIALNRELITTVVELNFYKKNLVSII